MVNGTDNNDYFAGAVRADAIYDFKGDDVIDGFDGGGEKDVLYGGDDFDSRLEARATTASTAASATTV